MVVRDPVDDEVVILSQEVRADPVGLVARIEIYKKDEKTRLISDSFVKQSTSWLSVVFQPTGFHDEILILGQEIHTDPFTRVKTCKKDENTRPLSDSFETVYILAVVNFPNCFS